MPNDASFIGNIPQYYDRGLGPIIFADYAADIARRAAASRPTRVLETAAGTGDRHARLARSPPGRHATDGDRPQSADARSRAARNSAPASRSTFQPADATALPFADGSFDLIVCQFGVMFYPDKEKSYREAYRVLAPGGHYLLSVWDSHRYNPFGRIANEIVSGFFPTDPPPFYKAPFSCHQIDPIKEMMIGAGFSDISVAVIGLKKDIPDVATFARAAVCGNPLNDQIKERGGEPEQVIEALAQAYGREFGGDPGRMPLQAIVFSGRKA